jgi:hypothetical protein
LFFFAFVLDSDAGNWVAFILLMAQGLGWLKIGRVGTGCMIGFARAIALWAVTIVSLISGIELLFCAWGGPDADNSDCNEGTLGVVFLTSLIALFITAFLVPIISAIMVGRASTRRAEWD